MDITKIENANFINKTQYFRLSRLSKNDKKLVYNLLSEKITDTNYNFVDMFKFIQTK